MPSSNAQKMFEGTTLGSKPLSSGCKPGNAQTTEVQKIYLKEKVTNALCFCCWEMIINKYLIVFHAWRL